MSWSRRRWSSKTGCREHLAEALEPYGLGLELMTEPVNAFMNARIDDVGRMVIFEPRSRAGGHVDVRATRGLLVAVSACAEVNDCIGGISTSIGLEIRPPGPRNRYA